jgi:hypothetical protein
MVGPLEALVGEQPAADDIAAALSTIPAAELADALRLFARRHGPAAVPLLARCLDQFRTGRPDWAVAAAEALGTVAAPAAAEALARLERAQPPKAVRTAARRGLYRLSQAGVVPAPAPSVTPLSGRRRPEPRQAWASAIDGTGSRGCWLLLEGELGERTLLSAAINDTAGFLDVAGGPIAKKRLDERLAVIRAESPLPWVEVPAAWALHLLAEARRRHAEAGTEPPADLARWQPLLDDALAATPPIYDVVPAADVATEPHLVDESAGLLAVPELAGWFLDPPTVQTEALELLQARESRLVVSDQIKAEREAALVDRVVEAHFDPAARERWRARLEEEAFVLHSSGRPAEARQAVAVALALADPARPARRIPFVRALVERSLEVAGEVALGRLPADRVRRVPPSPLAATP